jgi:hypothetical protein
MTIKNRMARFLGAGRQYISESTMLKDTRLGLVTVVALGVVLASTGCGGVGAAPINGGTLARVAVTVAPPTMTVTTGTTQAFTATVVNTSESGVGWLVNGFPGGVSPTDGSTPFGTIDKNGNYTAPPFIPAPPTVTVTAVANADNSATANASVLINGTPSPVSIAPLSANLEVGGIALFTATVNDSDPSVTWLVENVPGGNAVVGTVSPVPDAPNKVIYLAPLTVPGGGQTAQVNVTAQSVANSQESASAAITLSVVGGTVVAITNPPVSPSVQAGETQPFQAKVTGPSDTTVSWEVDAIPGGNAALGTIATGAKETAVYTAPAQVLNPFQVFVTAVSNAQPAAQASLLVNVIPAQKVTVAIAVDECTNPAAIVVNSSATFTATVNGPSNQNVTWQVNQIPGGNSTIGTITAAGVYTAPANVPNPATVVVGAASVANPKVVGTESITISLVPATKVTVTPTSASVQENTGQDFTAVVAGLGNTNGAVTWNVNNESGGDPTIGTIDPGTASGCENTTEYLAPVSIPTPPTVYVTAVASDGTTSYPAAAVTIVAPPPITEALTPGQSDPQTVQVQTSNNTVNYQDTQYKLENGEPVVDTTDPVNWTLTSENQDCSVSHGSICGTLTPMGVVGQAFTATYTAPDNVPPNPIVTVTVTSAIDPGASDFNQITITNAPPTITITGPNSVQAGTNGPYSYTAVIQGANPESLVWQLGCISDWDGISSDGNCEPTRQDDYKDGPGCIMYGSRQKVCGADGALTIPTKTPLTYVPPLTVSTTDYEQNACTLNGNPDASIVPINVSMQATGCPGNPPTCTATACVTVTPQQ